MRIPNVEPQPLRTGPLDEDQRARVAALVHARGEKIAAKLLGLSRHATARAMAGMAIHPGTHLIIARYFTYAAAAASTGRSGG